MTFEKCTSNFEVLAKRSISMPIAGAIVWLFVALLSTRLSEASGILVLSFGSGVIFPLALRVLG